MGDGVGWAYFCQYGKFDVDGVAMGVVCEVKVYVEGRKSVSGTLAGDPK